MEVKSVPSFKDVQEAFDNELLLKDRDVIRVVAATFIGNQMYFDPIWLMVVASSSGGKTHIINTLNELSLDGNVEHVIPISDITENTFASGFRRNDKDSSLLNRVPWGGILTFKDFTSILSKRRETREIIMGQLREIYDGEYVKRTGMGDDITWYGKIGAIAGVTEAVYEYLESLSIMGDRFVMYSINQPDRKQLIDFVLDRGKESTVASQSSEYTKQIFHNYLKHAYNNLSEIHIHLDEESEEKIKQVADFCTRARSGVIEDYRTGAIKFVPAKEMPIRMVKQLLALGSAFVFMRSLEHNEQPQDEEGRVSILPNEMKILQKIAFDSVPIKRRLALRYLAEYKKGVHTSGLATKLGYQTDVVKQWLAQLSALGLCMRIKQEGTGNKGDLWRLKEEFRDLMLTLNNIEAVEGSLHDDDEIYDELIEGSWTQNDDVASHNEQMEQLWNDF